jgi:Predicted Zn-dependent hydrolases of the beta-lactamase fold
MKITFIEHSGFMVEMEHTVLLFDYYHGKIPTFDKNKMLYVFVSHSHADHYNPVIWELKEQYEKVQYIISDDVKTKENSTSYETT